MDKTAYITSVQGERFTRHGRAVLNISGAHATVDVSLEVEIETPKFDEFARKLEKLVQEYAV